VGWFVTSPEQEYCDIYDALVKAFNDLVKPLVHSPSKYEKRFWALSMDNSLGSSGQDVNLWARDLARTFMADVGNQGDDVEWDGLKQGEDM
jgi:hypothetical protein